MVQATHLVLVGVFTFLLLLLLIYPFRKKGWPTFGAWWNSEGVPIYFIALVVAYALATRIGFLR